MARGSQSGRRSIAAMPCTSSTADMQVRSPARTSCRCSMPSTLRCEANGSTTSHDFRPMLAQRLAVTAAGANRGAVVQDQRGVAIGERPDFADTMHVHDHAPMDADEL